MAKERRGIKVNSQLTVSLALMRPYYLVIYHRAESSLSSSLRVSLTTLGYLEVTEVFCALTREEMECPAHSHPPRSAWTRAGRDTSQDRHEVRALDLRSAGCRRGGTAAWRRVDDRRVISGHCAWFVRASRVRPLARGAHEQRPRGGRRSRSANCLHT